jgi:hypothetical protein
MEKRKIDKYIEKERDERVRKEREINEDEKEIENGILKERCKNKETDEKTEMI